jgi:hypothetical protein
MAPARWDEEFTFRVQGCRAGWVDAMLWLMLVIGAIGLVVGGAFRAPALIAATALAIPSSIIIASSAGMNGWEIGAWAFGAFAMLNIGFFCAASARNRFGPAVRASKTSSIPKAKPSTPKAKPLPSGGERSHANGRQRNA